MKYYLAHIYGTDAIFDNMVYIVGPININLFGNTMQILNNDVKGEKICLHQEINVKPNPYNPERINITFEDREYQYIVSRYHHENLEMTIYDRVDE